jgi:RNA polymerase sigma-70 factor (ECF subfamily)
VVLPSGAPTQVRGAHHVLREAPGFSRHARFAEPALVNGALGALVAPRGQMILALTFAIKDDKIVEFEVIAEPARLDRLDLAVLDRRPAG